MKRLRWLRGFLAIQLLSLFILQGEGYPGQNPQETRTLETEEIAGILRDHLQRLIHDGNRRVEIKEIRGHQKTTVPPGNLSCEITVPEQAHKGGTISAILRFQLNGQEVKRLSVTARVEIYADVVSVSRYLKKHQEIEEKDVQLENRNISLLAPDVVTDVKAVLGKRTTLSVNGREILRTSMVELVPAVKKGDRIMLLVEGHQFKITTLGEAKEEGRRGERIKLVNLSSKKEVYGKVLDTSTVQVDF
jgi:flagellar basal body P-ring formation protein FlgA